ncbi:MAG: cytosine permease [Pseudomonadota bacterium]
MKMDVPGDHANSGVPSSELVSGFYIGQIFIGIAITLPAFLLGAQVFSALGLGSGLATLIIAAAILFGLSALTTYVGASTRLSTYKIIELTFGSVAARGVNALFWLVMLGWFAITASLFANALGQMVSSLGLVVFPTAAYKIFVCVLTISFAIYGFKAIDRLSRLAVPLLLLVLVVACLLLLKDIPLHELGPAIAPSTAIASIGAGVSVMIGAFMVGIVIAPDMARFARSPKDALVASLMSYGSGSVLVMALAGIPALATGSVDFVGNVASIGFAAPALAVIVFATLTTNVNTLYSVSLSADRIIDGYSSELRVISAGAIGAVMSILGIENHFIPFLLGLSIAIPPVAGVYATNYLIQRGYLNHAVRAFYLPALFAWAAASGVAAITFFSPLTLTTAPAIDGFLAACAVYYALKRLF